MQTRWTITEDFSPGFRVKRDATQLPAGALIVSSQNVEITDGDRVGTRAGSVIDGSTSSALTPITSLHTFKKRDGTEVPMRAYGTVLEYRHPSLGTWQNLMTGLTTGQPFGFADHNVNTEFIEKVCFCNAIEPYSTWSGAYTQLNGALAGGEATITVDSVLQDTVFYSGTASAGTTTTITIATSDWGTDIWNSFYVYVTSGTQSGKISKISATTATQITFTALSGAPAASDTFQIRKIAYRDTSDMTLRIGTSDVTYTGFGTATTFTGASGTPAAADNAAVTQAVLQYKTAPRGNILLVNQTRMFVSGVLKSRQSVYYSKLLDATDFSFSATRVAAEGGVIDSPEGGGAITGLGVQENVIFMLKNDIIKTVYFTQDGTDLPQIEALVQAPNVGANYFLGVFKIDNQVYYTTKEGGVKTVTRVENVTTMQSLQLSDPISAYVKNLVFTASAGIFYKQKAYIACRSTDATYNDLVLVYNFQKSAWEPPIIGWNVGAWTIYNGDLYFGSSLNPEVYQVDSDRFDDNNNPFESIARFTFSNYGQPMLPKEFESFFLEGYITENTTITINLLYNYLGSQESRSSTLAGTEEAYIVADASYNLLGISALALDPLASTTETTDDLQKFRVYFQTPRQPFYELGVEISSNAAGARWEILRFGTDAQTLPNPVTSLRKKLS